MKVRPRLRSTGFSLRHRAACMRWPIAGRALWTKWLTFDSEGLHRIANLDEAITVVRDLFCRREPLNPHEQDYLGVVSHEIEPYEAEAYPLPRVTEAALLRHLLEAQDASLSAAAEATGIAPSTLSAVANGKRSLNVKHIRLLSAYFGVEAGVFLE